MSSQEHRFHLGIDQQYIYGIYLDKRNHGANIRPWLCCAATIKQSKNEKKVLGGTVSQVC